MKPVELSEQEARQLAVNAQFPEKNDSIKGKNFTALLIDQLGYVQIDTISVVNRAHHHTLWARSDNYSEEFLHQLQATERKIYEYWGHAMSYLPIENFRYSLPRMYRLRNPSSAWAKNQAEKSKNIIREVKNRIRDEGPLSSKDFENPEGCKGKNWWDWKPAKIALEVLFWQGELMISERKNFQKVYDLTERVLPPHIDTSFPSPEETAQFIIISALRAFGIASEKEIRNFLQPASSRDADLQLADSNDIIQSLEELAEEGKVTRIKIEGIECPYYLSTEILEGTGSKKSDDPQVKLLSPFDNLIIQRERTKQLFKFDYSLECYTPAHKRKYGYFVFPILLGNNLVGRLDPKADRKNNTLIIKSLILEPGFYPAVEFIKLLAGQIKKFAVFNNCKEVILDKCTDPKLRKELKMHFSDKITE